MADDGGVLRPVRRLHLGLAAGRIVAHASRRGDLRPRLGRRCWFRSPPRSARRSPCSPRASCCATGCRTGSARSCAASTRASRSEGGFYLFTLRLMPAVPSFSSISRWDSRRSGPGPFTGSARSACSPATVLYVNAGTQLARLESLRDVLSWQLIGAFVLLGIFPLVGEEGHRARQGAPRLCALAAAAPLRPQPDGHRRRFRGTGRRLYRCRGARPKVTLVEKQRMGGDCLNTGCVPSKALIKSARVLSQIKNSRKFGIRQASAEFDFADVMERVQRVIRASSRTTLRSAIPSSASNAFRARRGSLRPGPSKSMASR